MFRQSPSRQEGFALPMVLLVSTLLMLLGMQMLRNASADLRFAVSDRDRARASLAAEMGLARGRHKIETDLQAGSLSSWQPGVSFQGETIDATGVTPAQKRLPDESYGELGGQYFYEATVTAGTNRYKLRYAITDEPWTAAGADATKVYTVEAVARDQTSNAWSGLRASYTVTRSLLLAYGAFFQDDLEILPQSAFSLSGRVHTNGSLYLGGTDTLTLDGPLTAAAHVFKGRKDAPTPTGDVRIRTSGQAYTPLDSDADAITPLAGFLASDLADPTRGDGRQSPTPDTWAVDSRWRQRALDHWNGQVRDQSHSITAQSVPTVRALERGGFYELNAGLKVITRASGSTDILRPDGTQVQAGEREDGSPISLGQFYNSRERLVVRVTTIDMQKLQAAGWFPSNGIIYATREDASPDATPADESPDFSRRPYGIRLINATSLPSATLIVSNVPVYIQGSFNTHAGSTDAWKPAAILCDSLTILSGSWNDAANAAANGQTASATEVNAVMIAGSRLTRSSEGYSGGLENFPRLLESWAGQTLTIRGSFVELWQSRFGTGRWQDTVYSAPARDWGYDPALRTTPVPTGLANLFPSTTREISQGQWAPLRPEQARLRL